MSKLPMRPVRVLEVSLESPWSEVTSIPMGRNHPLLGKDHLKEVAGIILCAHRGQGVVCVPTNRSRELCGLGTANGALGRVLSQHEPRRLLLVPPSPASKLSMNSRLVMFSRNPNASLTRLNIQ